MNDESNALREHVVKYQKAGMKDYFKWSQEAANLMRQAAAQIESLTRSKENALKTEALQSGVIAGLQMRNVALERENKTLRAELDAATYTAFIDDPDTLPPSVVKAAQDAICIEFGITGTAGYFKRIIAKILKSLITARSRGETGEKIG